MKNLKRRLYSILLLPLAISGGNALAEGLANPRSEIIVEKQLLDRSPADWLCTGSVEMELPALGKCPDYPGYVTLGFPVCTQTHSVPRKFTFKEIFPGYIKLVCELDLANATPIADPVCDYSHCSYIKEPRL